MKVKIFISHPEYQEAWEPRHSSSCTPPPGDQIIIMITVTSNYLYGRTDLSRYFLQDCSGQFKLPLRSLQLMAELHRVEDSTRDVLVQVWTQKINEAVNTQFCQTKY